MKQKNTFLFSIVLFLIILSNQKINAQTPGLIYENQGITVLDPNSDEYVSQNSSGFNSNDLAESEISYTPIPVLEIEPDSDPILGPDCSYIDIVDSGSDDPVLVYYDGTNLLFRFRVSGTASNTKGYSIMVDSDQKFGFTGSEADIDAVVGNPGFEFEIVLETEYGIGLYDVNGSNIAGVADPASNRPYTDYAQKSIAFSTICGNPDYFYDFYVPMADLTIFGIDANTPLRFVGATVMDHTAFIGSSLASDIAGTDENYFGDIFECIPPIRISEIGTANIECRTSCPTITDPITHGATTVSGISTEQDGTVIEVFKNGSSVGTTTVSTGSWSLTGISQALASGDEIKATAKDGNRYVSFDDCDIKIVECSPVLTNLEIYWEGLCGEGYISGAAFKVYHNGIEMPQGGDTIFTPSGGGVWTYNCNNNSGCDNGLGDCMERGWYDITQEEIGSCESKCVGIHRGDQLSTDPLITNPIYTNTDPVSGNGVDGSTIILYQDNHIIGTGTVSGGTWSISPTVSLTACSQITARQVESGRDGSGLTAPITVLSTDTYHKPVIAGNYCIPAATTVSTVTGTSVEEENSVIDVLVNGSSVGTTLVAANQTWEITGLSVNIGDEITAQVIDGSSCLSESAVSDAVTVTQITANTAVITGTPIYEGENTVSGNGTSLRTINLYQDNVFIGSTNVFSGNWNITNLNLNTDTKLYAGGVLTVTETEGTNCESVYSTPDVIVQCNAPANNLIIGAVQSEYCENENVEIIVESSENDIIYTPVLASDGTTVAGYSGLGTGADLILQLYPLSIGITNITVKAEKKSNISCVSINTNDTSIQINPLPDETLAVSPATTSICRYESVDITITAAENNVTYQLQNNSTGTDIGSASVGNGSDLTISTGVLDESVTIKVKATDSTYPITNCSVDLSNIVDITVTGALNDQVVTVDDVTLCQNNSTNINVATNNDGFSYQIKNSGGFDVGTAFTGTGGSFSRSTGNLIADETFYVEVDDGAGCTVRILDEETVAVLACLRDIHLEKTVDDNTPDEGQDVTFSITVTNNEPTDDVTNLVVTDNLPAGLTYNSGATPAPPAGTTWTYPDWAVGTLLTGESKTLTIVATVDAGTSGTVITNTISNTQYETDDNTTTDDDLEEITITSTADLSVTTHGDETGSQNIVYTVTLSAPNNTGSAITFDFNDLETGTATSGTDYTAVASGSQISVADGATTGTITITVLDDALFESTETINCRISNSSEPAVNITTDSATADIADDDGPNAALSVTTNGNESGPVNIVYTITLSVPNNTGSTITFDFDDIGGSATSGTDYTAIGGAAQISVADGSSTGTITIPVINDDLFEATETVNCQISNPSNPAVIITTPSATADITDNDTATASLSVTTQGNESGPQNIVYTVTLNPANNTGSAITFDFDDLVTGTATSGDDYTAILTDATISIADNSDTGTFTIFVTDDSVLEITETLDIQISNPSDNDVSITTPSATANITDNDTADAILSVTTQGNEAGPIDIVYTVTLTAENGTGSPITFDFDDLKTGTATSEDDYTAIPTNATISIADGSNSGTITISVLPDALFEADETVIAQISNADNTNVSFATDEATANIIDDETATASLNVTTHGDEEGPQNIVYTVTLSTINNTGSAITFDFDDVGGSATSGDDYTAILAGATISIADNTNTGIFSVSVTNDSVLEITETLDIQISNPSDNDVSISTANATADITDNDTATADLSVTTHGNEAGPQNIVYTVTLTAENGTGSPITFEFDDLLGSGTGTATSGADYTAVAGSAQISVADGSSTGTITIPVINDALFEATETVNCQISLPSNSDVTIGINNATANILDNNAANAVLSVTIAGDEEGEVAIEYTVTLSPANNTGSDITFDFSDLGTGTAEVGSDYNAVDGLAQITILNGEATGIITIPVNNDGLFESTETVNCQISNSNNTDLTITTASATADILDNESINATLNVETDGNEAGPVDIVYSVTLSLPNNTGTAITFDFEDIFSGSAISGTDYTAVDGAAQISVADNSSSGTIIIPVIDDSYFEADETINAKISNCSNSTVNTTTDEATAIIIDNESVDAELSVSTHGDENGSIAIEYTVTLSSDNNTGSDITFDFDDLETGTALSGIDYTAVDGAAQIIILNGEATGTITINVTDDNLFESTETVNCQISSPNNTDVTITANTATAEIFDNETATADLSVTTDGDENGPIDIVYTVTLNTINYTGTAITFEFDDQLSGTAISGSDYTAIDAGAQISIDNGASTGTFTISVTDDALLEVTENINIQIIDPSDNDVTINTNTATADIIDNETPTAELSVTTNGDESGPVDIVYTVTISNENSTGTPITFDFVDLLTGTATSATDYTAVAAGAQITINNNTNSGNIIIPIIDDIFYEPTETIDAEISNPSNGIVTISTPSATADIFDDDFSDIVLTKTVDNDNPNEGEDITFTINVTNNGPSQLTGLFITDVIPAGLTFVSATPSTGSWTNPDWTIGTLNIGSNETLTIVTNVDVGTGGNTIINTISNTQEQLDDNTTTDDDSETIYINDIPVANNDSETVDEDDILISDVLINDTGLNNGGIVVSVITNVINGNLALNIDGTFTYTPDADYHGTDSFVYEVCDIDNECDQATVNITIISVNDFPIAQDDDIDINEDSELNEIFILEDNGYGADYFGGDRPSIGSVELISGTQNGNLEFNDNDTPDDPTDDYFIYTTEYNFYGIVSFEYEICDSDGDCDQAIVNINVINDEVLFIPEVFTPNGDGFNDLFVLEGLEMYPENSILIFNRWGNKVFEASPYNNDWDGKSNFGISPGGNELSEGTYFYILKTDNEQKELKGYIYLKK